MQMRDKNYIKLDNKAMVLFNGLFINYYLLMVFSLFNARLPCFMTFLKKKKTDMILVSGFVFIVIGNNSLSLDACTKFLT